ncbi:MAG: FAD-binding oxidoreductase [Acidobacteriaceae bacterium]|nr:FAD-binding oxidoreductase [Acidobacteriaceae bacterium]
MPISPAAVGPYLEDSSGYRGSAEKVVIPADVQEVREIVQICAKQNIPLTIAGAGTGLTGARVPHGGWVISLERFRKIEIARGRARCGAYVTLGDLHEQAAKSKQFLGPNPTETSASVGGAISTNAGGARSFHYGSLRRHVAALEVTFMDGRTVQVKRGDKVDFPITPVRVPETTKNSAGYYLRPNLDWVDLLAGSEGTLAIVTEAELTLLPEPAAILSGVVFFPTDEQTLDAVDSWRSIAELRFLEYIDAPGLDLLRDSYPEIPPHARAALLIEQNLASEDDPEVDVWAERLAEAGAFEQESWFGFTAADRERFRKFRHTLPQIVVDRVRRNGYPKFGTDFAVPLDRHRELHGYYQQRCEEVLPGQYTIFGHIGDANNHVNLMPVTAEQAASGEALIFEFAEYVVSLGGTVAAEHGIGKNKTDLLKLMYSPEEIQAMRGVKQRVDPQWLLGRGTIFDTTTQGSIS